MGIGAFSTLFIYTRVFESHEYGALAYVKDMALFIAPMLLLGTGAVNIRYFPFFRDTERGHNGFLFFLFLSGFIGWGLFLAVYHGILKEVFIQNADPNSDAELIEAFIGYILPMTFFAVIFIILNRYCWNFQRIAIPAVFTNLLLKIGFPTLAVLYFFDWISLLQVMQGLVLTFALMALGMIWYTWHLGELHLKPNWTATKSRLNNEVFQYALYGFFGGISGLITTQIDKVMLGPISGYSDVAYYTIAVFLAAVIELPRKAISNISAPIISQSWKDDNRAHLLELYQKSSITQLILGGLFFLVIVSNLDPLFEIMPKGEEYSVGKSVMILLGFARLIDMATGVNNELIDYSKYYRFNFFAIILMAIFNIIANRFLIPIYGIDGAAIATCSSVLLYNLMKFIFIWVQLKMQPFQQNTFWVFLIGLFTFFIISYLPNLSNPWLAIPLNGILVLLLFLGPILYKELSPDVNDLVTKGIKQIQSILKL